MAAGIIQNLSKFRLPTAFQHSFLPTTACQEILFQDLSEEEEMEEEEEEEEEERDDMELEDSSTSLSPNQGGQATSDESNAEMTLQLLQFAERISDDIQKYFGGKTKEEDADSRNIYDDSCSQRLSGRVLYYADLVRISQSGELEEGGDFSDTLKTPAPLDPQLWKCLCGKDGAVKLGPLAELFEYGLCRYIEHRAPPEGSDPKVERKYSHVTPMQSRKLPQSFWKEPSHSPVGILNSNPPDFSDLLANWTSETSQEGLNGS
ncbi:protein PERCC1 [Eublepharis macularius]|uniref:Protein PERCC1 n=1 Tax=Eublepharis macularius TaxID=481883 RepID=A0AA97KAP7_EUBMA|nr:protein PERCC1 [Eublepharis macularius]